MAYYVHTHKADKILRKHLFRINGISYEEMLEKFLILLDDEHEGQSGTMTIANLPTNEDVMQLLQTGDAGAIDDNNVNFKMKIQINQLCVVAWQNYEGKYEWYTGYVKSFDNGSYIVDHLHRDVEGSHTKWKYPGREDLQTVAPQQIIECDIQGQWDFSPDSRKRLFLVSNVKTICGAFQKYIS